jgi:hypothetical protein
MQPEIHPAGDGKYRGVAVHVGQVIRACPHRHREPTQALICAERLARRLGWRPKLVQARRKPC